MYEKSCALSSGSKLEVVVERLEESKCVHCGINVCPSLSFSQALPVLPKLSNFRNKCERIDTF